MIRANDEALWTAADVADYLHVSKSWVEHNAPAGRIPSVMIGRMRRFVPAEIREFALRGRGRVRGREGA